jgi:hypothetical protein
LYTLPLIIMNLVRLSRQPLSTLIRGYSKCTSSLPLHVKVSRNLIVVFGASVLDRPFSCPLTLIDKTDSTNQEYPIRHLAHTSLPRFPYQPISTWNQILPTSRHWRRHHRM